MRDAILAKLVKTLRAGLAVDTALWVKGFKSEETRAVAVAALEKATETADRCRWVLFARYGIDLRFTPATKVIEEVGLAG